MSSRLDASTIRAVARAARRRPRMRDDRERGHGAIPAADATTLATDGSARHRAARVARRARRGGRRPRPAGVGLGGRAARQRHRRACRPRRPRNEVPPLPADPGTPRGPVADRLDQHPGTQLHLQAPGRRPGRGLRRGHVLRPVRHDPAAAARGPRLRRHRLPAGRRGGDLRGPDAGRRAGRGAGTGRPRDVAAQSVPGAVRPRAGGDGHERRRDAVDVHARPDRCRRRRWASSRQTTARTSAQLDGRPAAGRPAAAPAAAGSASSTRRRSTTTGPTAATRPCARAFEIGPEARHRRGHRIAS